MKSDTGATPCAPVEQVILLDPAGRPSGTAPKHAVHHRRTPYHLAFSSHIVREDGRVLLTRRALRKATWPGAWTNACCGHPATGETLREAVARRLGDELGLRPVRMAVALPRFSYRATMPDGTVEHELCPVVLAEVDGDPVPDPGEVDGTAWVTWRAFLDRAARRPDSLSPWSVAQAAELAPLVTSPLAWLDAHAAPPAVSPARRLSTTAIGLDTAVVVPPPAGSPGPEA
ncbi:MAG TPA: isopentenyl-diphosphate Delta-isomerase [Acidimicrobiales bacterium]|nr:isopentenyl-diphosphate Delta-isomerase [Acidimicrobiales bacterium]